MNSVKMFANFPVSPEIRAGFDLKLRLAAVEIILWALTAVSGQISSEPRPERREICHEEIGCLSLEPPWDLLWGHVPKPPVDVGVHFYHRSRAFPVRKEIVEDAESRALDDMGVDVSEEESPDLGLLELVGIEEMRLLPKGRKGCKVIFHGFASSSAVPWVIDLEDALLAAADSDVITIDWSEGAAGPNYFQAVANTRTVAALVARFLRKLFDRDWCSTSELHLIGQSLGAHLASYVASNLTNVAEITGLDPAQPWFENNSHETHLDTSDAEFVQVVHTNILPFWPNLGLGFSKPSGHVDFYINGGGVQPGCSNALRFLNYFSGKLAGMVHWLACSHLKAQEYYIEALRLPFSCRYTGIPWEPHNKDPPSLKGRTCSLSSCQQLGLLSKHLPARGTFYIFTNYTDTYCVLVGVILVSSAEEGKHHHKRNECEVTPVIHVLQYPGCVPKPIPSFACQGRCSSYIQVSGSKIWQMERSCMCCQESGEREASVSLFCPKAKPGERKFRKVMTKAPLECMCRPCTSVEESTVIPQEIAGYVDQGPLNAHFKKPQ